MIKTFIISLAITLVFELTTAFFLHVRDHFDFVFIALANVITNPVVVFIQMLVIFFCPRFLVISAAVLECSAVLAEWQIFKKVLRYNRISPFVLSLILNGVSFAAGELYKIVF